MSTRLVATVAALAVACALQPAAGAEVCAVRRLRGGADAQQLISAKGELLAARAFEEALRRAGVAVRAVRLPRDNHWTMPASADFLAALRAELPALERQSKK